MEVQELLELNNLLEELKLRQTHASQTYIPDNNPGRDQLKFHTSDRWCRLLFGGNRSGKSRAAAQEIYWWFSSSHPYIKTPKNPRIWVLSAEYRTIYEGIWLHLKNVIPPWDIAKIGPKIPGWDLPSYIESKKGARIDFISAQGGDDTRRKVQAAEIDLLAIDEEVSSDLWLELEMRLLTRGGKIIVSATLIQSEEWLIDLEIKGEQGNEDVELIRLDTTLNKFNDQKALKRILDRLSDQEKEVRIYGKSRKATGLIYSNWTSDHEVNPFKIPDHWTKIMVFDAGFRVSAALWVAIDEKNYCTAYREMYLEQGTLGEAVKFIRSSEGYKLVNGVWTNSNAERIYLRLIDPSAFRHLEDGSVGVGYQLANDYNLFFSRAINDKRTNIEDVRRLLLPDHEGGIPRFRIFNTLVNFKAERQKYRMKPDKSKRDSDAPVGRPIKKHDHLMNCVEYFGTAKVQFYGEQSYQDQIEQMAKQDNYHTNNRMTRVLVAKKRRQLERKNQINELLE